MPYTSTLRAGLLFRAVESVSSLVTTWILTATLTHLVVAAGLLIPIEALQERWLNGRNRQLAKLKASANRPSPSLLDYANRPDTDDTLGGQTLGGDDNDERIGKSLGDQDTMGGDKDVNSLGEANFKEDHLDDGIKLEDLSER